MLKMKDITSSPKICHTSVSVILVVLKSSSSLSASPSSPPLSFDESDLPRLLSYPERSEGVFDDSSQALIMVGLVGFVTLRRFRTWHEIIRRQEWRWIDKKTHQWP